MWTAIVAACVAWQPLLLGFYLDDWDLWVNGATKGTPFGLTRLTFMNFTNPVRIGCLPGRFLGSSLFGAHPLLWQGSLLLVNCLVAISIIAAARALNLSCTPTAKTVTAAAGLCWLLLPWNAGVRFWSALLPNTSMIAAQGFLCVLLIRGWARNKSRPVLGGALYLWMCLSYEVFYLQWIAIILLGLVLWMTKRAKLGTVIVSGSALIVAQGLAGLWNLYTRHAGYWTAMSVLPDWTQIARRNLLNVVPSAIQSVSEISSEFLTCAIVVIAMWLVAYVRSLMRPGDRRAAYTSVALAGIAIFGGLMSVVVYSLAGRIVMPTGIDTRSLGVFNFWLLIAAAILTTFAMERLSGAVKLVFVVGIAGFALCLAVGQVLRAGDWATAWNLQKKILAEAPVSDLRHTEQDARIVLVNPREVNGAPVFAASWDINNALPWAYPFLRGRRIIVYNPWEGPMKWNGSELSYMGQPARETTTVIYVWHPADLSFWRASGPFVINQDLTIAPAQ